MGILTKKIENHIHKDSTGRFELFYGSLGEFMKFTNEKTYKNSLKMKNGKLSSGFLSLVEPDENKQFGAYIDVGTAK